MYTQSTPAPDGTPGTECRISGGLFDDGDRTSRVGFGVRVDDTAKPGTLVWAPLLTMDGGGRMAMPQKGTVLEVGHTLQLPPITTNPVDPLTQDLLALAYNAGLHRVNKISSTTPSLTAVTSPVALGGTFTYTLKFVETATIKVKRILEIIYGKGSNGDWILRSVPVPADGSLATGHAVTLSPFWHRANAIVLRIDLLVSDAGKDCGTFVESGEITVNQ
jgi:hypothetical protein